MQAASDLVGAYNFPCLDHVINLIVKRFVLKIESTSNEDEFELSETDENVIPDSAYDETVQKVRQLTRKIKGTSQLNHKLAKLQEAMGRRPLEIIYDVCTRWNSLYSSLQRFLDLKEYILLLLEPDDLQDFSWSQLCRICKVLKPLKVIYTICVFTMHLKTLFC